MNLPIKDLSKTKAFFSALGLSFNERFTNDDAACLVIGESIYAMLLTEPFFKGFTKKEICDSSTHVEALLALQVESREEVDAMMEKALAAGGNEPVPAQDHGWMYSRDFEDVDGHVWEVFYADPSGPPES